MDDATIKSATWIDLMSRRKARKDDNHNEIQKGLEAIGASVFDTSGVGSGFSDVVVGFRNKNFLLEIKDGNKPPSKRKLTPDEIDFKTTWNGQYNVVKNLAEALQIITEGGYNQRL